MQMATQVPPIGVPAQPPEVTGVLASGQAPSEICPTEEGPNVHAVAAVTCAEQHAGSKRVSGAGQLLACLQLSRI